MFLYQSNRLECLFAALAHNLAQPVEDPLEPEIIVVQNQGMAQWVSRQLALSNGIAANLQFPLPGRCIWDLYDRFNGEVASEDLFQAAILRWRIFAILPQLLEEPGFAAPAAYLADDPEQNRLYQLSAKIADTFDQYQVYRPDLLALWQTGEEEHWQAVLWRALTQISEAERVALPAWWRQQLEQEALEQGLLPGRLHLFGLNALAPVYLEIFGQVGQLLPLHLYHLSPCQHYWGDLVSGRQQAALRAQGKLVGEEYYHEEGHPLLSSLGRTGQEFFQQLQQYQLEDVDLYQAGEEEHLLAVLQNDILNLEDRSQDPELRYQCAADDRSIQLHCCFSPLREIQVLHDRLLDLLTAHPDLTPGDILVSAPNIERYSEAIAGVFGETQPQHRIPWSLADQSFVREQPAVRCFLELLQLLESRCTAPEVMALCEHPLVLARFGLESGQLSQLNRWVQSAGIRWGLDGAHREELEIKAGEMHSWQFGLDRLLLGYCMGPVAGNIQGLLPYGELAMGEAESLGGFGQLIATLSHWQHAVRQARTPEQWCRDFLLLVDDFFATEGEDPGLALLRETIIKMGNNFRLAEFAAQLPYAVLRSHLLEQLSQTSGGQPFLSGRVTFCNMVPMRSVPFRVICLLGMGDQEFPRSQRPPSFDLMASAPRVGDRNRRNDDRYLFLEALLSARDVLYLSWVGRSQRDESQIPPSVVIAELCDYIDASAQGTDASDTPLSKLLTTEHPMQPFSRRCYSGDLERGSYNPAWLPAASREDPPPFWSTSFAQTVPGEVELDQLIRFWRHPTRFFLEQGLGMRLRTEDVALSETEPFTLNGLEQYLLREETIASRLQERDPKQWAEGIQGSGRLPQAGFGQVLFGAIDQEAQAFAEILNPLVQGPQEPLEIDLTLGSFRLRGWLKDLYGGTRVSWRSGRLRGSDLMEWWINHLCLNLLSPGVEEITSCYISWEKVKKQKVITINRLLPVQQSQDILQRLLTLFSQGCCRPLLFFSETSLAWAEAKEGTALEAARKKWEGNFILPGEGEEAAYGYLYQSFEEIIGDEFAELTEIYSQILAHMEVVDAAA